MQAKADQPPKVRGNPVAIRRLIGVLAALAALAMLAAAALAVTPAVPAPAPLPFLVVVVTVAASRLAPLRLRFGSNTVSFVWGEAALIISLALIPSVWVVLITPVAAVAVYARDRLSRSKVVFNTSVAALGTALAAVVFEILRRQDPSATDTIPALKHFFDHPAMPFAVLAAAIVWSVAADLATAAAVGLSEDLPVWSVLRSGYNLRLVSTVGNVTAALVIVAIAAFDKYLGIVVPVALYTLNTAYEQRLRAYTEREMWQRLDRATHALNHLVEASVVESAIQEAATLFGAAAVEIHLLAGDDGEPPARTICGDVTGVGVGHAACTTLEGEVIRARLDTPKGPVGELRLRFSGTVQLHNRETSMLSTFATSVSSAVLNARLFEQAHREVERKQFAATHDPLTGLANRALLLETGAGALAEAAGTGGLVALLLLDLDHFKQVNDTLGHHAGDLLLQQVARRLHVAVRRQDTVVRLGGDEFALLLVDLTDPAAAISTAAGVLKALGEPLEVDGVRVAVEGSIGVACADDADPPDVMELLRRADVAMYQAKASATNIEVYSSDRDDANVTRLALIPELRTALARNEMELRFQPQIDLATGMPVSAEALAHWPHPRRGVLPPDSFIPVVESSDLVHEFTLYVADRALAQCARWQAAGLDLRVAVNLSARNLLDHDLAGELAVLLQRHNVAPDDLVLEITETAVMRQPDVVERVLGQLRTLGVQLSVDDFGTGYSSLAFLSRLVLDEIKVDRSFVAGMLDSAGDAAIVRATIDMAHSFGLRVVAEGVETAEQQQELRRLGCDAAQGFLISRPMLAQDIEPNFRRLAADALPLPGAKIIQLGQSRA